MFSTKITFPKKGNDLERMTDSVVTLLAAWDHNGQISGGPWPLADTGGALEAFVTLPAMDSMDTVHNSQWAGQSIAALSPGGFTVTVLGRDPSLPGSCSCPSRSALVLFTHFLSEVSPVSCLDCFNPVALYTLPHPEGGDHSVLLQWAADYRACDSLQMLSTTGVRFGENQMRLHDSSLSRNGRSLCSRLEALTHVPVYYYLHRFRSRGAASELRRCCPSCGSPWLLENRLHLFDFRCGSCRLLSSAASRP